MTHLTINTGHSAVSSPGDVDIHQVEPVLGPLIREGGGVIGPVPELSLQIPATPAGVVFSIWRGDQPVCLNAVAWDQLSAAAAWSPIESTYLDLAETSGGVALGLGSACPEMPATVPWLATLLLPGIVTLSRETSGLLGDLERCIAAVVLHHRGLWIPRKS